MTTEYNNVNFFSNKDKTDFIFEYGKELKLLKETIFLAEDYLKEQRCFAVLGFEWVCHLFAESIVEHMKMAYDNMILGHFDAVNMINRVIIENNVCLSVIIDYKEDELWKYWIVHSMYKAHALDKKKKLHEINYLLKDIYKEYGIEKIFIEKHSDSRDKRAYIEKDYGWTYKVNKKLSFKGLCELKKEYRYSDFGWMSSYSHGTSLYQKMIKSTLDGNVMDMMSCLYYNLHFLMTEYWGDVLDLEFFELAEELDDYFQCYVSG